MPSGATLSRIVIAQSLEPDEVQTGTILATRLNAQNQDADGLPGALPAEVVQCPSGWHLVRLFDELCARALVGERPMLHIECHGSVDAGLQFENGSTMSWATLGAHLTELNIASRFNLPVAVSACYGAHLTGQFLPTTPAPAWCIVAPSHEVSSPELMNGFSCFYGTLFATQDAGKASTALRRASLDTGAWFSMLAEDFFVEVMKKHLLRQLSPRGFHRWAKAAWKRQAKVGSVQSRRQVEDALRQFHLTHFPDKYFDRYFCVDRVPESGARFAATKAQIKDEIVRLSAMGAIVI